MVITHTSRILQQGCGRLLFKLFKIKLASATFVDLQTLHMLTLGLSTVWSSFFLLNTATSYSKDLNRKQTIVPSIRVSQQEDELVMLKITVVITISTFVTLLSSRFLSGYIFFDQLFIDDSMKSFAIITLIVYALTNLHILFLWDNKITVPTDLACLHATFFLAAPLLWNSPNFYAFFFIIELLGLIILVKFTFLPLSYSSKGVKKGAVSSAPKPLVLSIFTYYWMSFFSSAFILLYTISMLFTWGTVDYFELRTLMGFSKFVMTSTSSIFYSLLGVIFCLGFLLKAGAAPFHSYKVSLFKGLPVYSVYIYTIVFYTTYITYFAYLLPVLIHTTGIVSGLITVAIIVFGTCFVTTSLYTNRQLKAFLALSSSLNALLVLSLLLSVA